jgi:hypothetical protein
MVQYYDLAIEKNPAACFSLIKCVQFQLGGGAEYNTIIKQPGRYDAPRGKLWRYREHGESDRQAAEQVLNKTAGDGYYS